MRVGQSITFKLTLVFVLYAASLLVILGTVVYSRARAALLAASYSELQASAIEKQSALDNWVNDRMLNATTLAAEPAIVSNLQAFFASSPGGADVSALHDRLIANLRPWTGADLHYDCVHRGIRGRDAERGPTLFPERPKRPLCPEHVLFSRPAGPRDGRVDPDTPTGRAGAGRPGRAAESE